MVDDIKIAVLLATCNGSKYLSEQLDSILGQTIACDILISDDGSTDRTPDLIEKYTRTNDRVHFVSAKKQGGVVQNFSALCEIAARSDHDFFLFADQDDIWLADKIEQSLAKLNARVVEITPCLVISDAKVVNDQLQVIHPSFWQSEKLHVPDQPELKNLLPQNYAPGCTMLFNRALLLKALPIPNGVIMHDWWFMLVAAGMGQIEVIRESLVLYRQHDENMIGSVKFTWERILGSILNPWQMKLSLQDTQHQAGLFLGRYGEVLLPEMVDLLSGYAELGNDNWFTRRLFLARSGIRKSGWQRNLGMFLLV